MNVQISCLWRGVMCGLLAAVVFPGIALAQGQGRGGFGGGFGGPPGAGGVGALLLMEEVQSELKLTDDQKSKLREAREELRGEAGGRRGGAPGGGANFRDMSQEERQKFMEDARKRMQEQAKKSEELARKVLTPEQMTRLNELRVQQEGVRALSRTEVAMALMLTDAQKEAIGDILEQARPQRGPGGGGPGGGGRGASAEEREKARAEAAERTRKTQADIEAVLTDTQKAEWTKLQGAKFTFPERPAFGAGGRGGRGGQGGEGAPGGGQNRRQRPNRPAPEA
ncbi:MAG: Spy/CpxP family protein refolding chaperone [Planctomycetaceae bacterium]|jgi:Spy/CpxP family protein refolding chaperone